MTANMQVAEEVDIPPNFVAQYKEPDVMRVLNPDGSVNEELYKWGPSISDKEVMSLLNHMILGRAVDKWAWMLHRQGRVKGTYGSYEGQEAVDIGSIYALRGEDWIAPSYRILGGLIMRGITLEEVFSKFFANSGDPEKGRNLPVEWGSKARGILSIGAPIGPHLIYAVGFAHALRYKKKDGVVMAFTGDGGTSTNGFHSALNFAGVFKTPNVFVIINNQYAISVPVSRQTAVARLSIKAAAYGLMGVSVDGNDLLAMYKVSKYAVERVRSGGAPFLLEAVTYRIGPHTTSDDPQTKYRPKEEVDRWRQLDPIARVKAYLLRSGAANEGDFKAMEDEAEERIKAAIKAAEANPPPPAEELVRDVYSFIPWNLEEEFGEIMGER
ncbi:pyruvate dehydrogenase (acetyl-transferring) E1 component subunit alpha [Thermocladium modestius]|uniref:2-oxoacid oxidoreductase (ferredoxin) n=1 Tax=Thermocladium modestius TaxID=62609 RepID=A0A830GV29_9CREN|nr:thiamine pyrophosphate-dependent enzyme [Thermocladium modestius]GGP19821.1 pyruvate dehydrogenase (acetyl-transferring) E1 component subunit alpha [Thermocladium modestius]